MSRTLNDIAAQMDRIEAMLRTALQPFNPSTLRPASAPIDMDYMRTGDPTLRRYSDDELTHAHNILAIGDRVALRAWAKINTIEMKRRAEDVKNRHRPRADVLEMSHG